MRVGIQLFGKMPRPHVSKTRLMPLLGPEGAAAAHARLLTHMVGVVRRWCGVAPDRRLVRLWCDPHPYFPFFSTLLPSECLRTQCGGDLGARMLRAVEVGLQEVDGVILLGGDVVSVDGGVLDGVEERLKVDDVVMGRAEDGGYGVLGLKVVAGGLFREMAWGTDGVAEETGRRLGELGCRWSEFGGVWDVDRPGDWARWVGGRGVDFIE